MKILFVASECAPFAKTGGLADVVAGLSKALHRMGHETRVVLPLYSLIEPQGYGLRVVGSHCIHMGGGVEHWIGVREGLLDEIVPVWFIEYDKYFGRMGLYDGPQGHYTDNAFRFVMFSKAAMQICKDRHWIPDLMHVHDWQTAPVALFLKTWDRVMSPLSNTASVLTIHNISAPGVYPPDVLPYIGVGEEHFTSEGFEDYGSVNLLKAGINYADAITTVSPTHAGEILTAGGGFGLAPYLERRHTDLFGILNGVDYDHWSPETDRFIPAHFSAKDLAGKATCKAALQQRFKLDARPDLPVFGIISRLAPQKGMDLIRDELPALLNHLKLQVVALGSGAPEFEDFFRWLPSVYPGRVGTHVGFDNPLSHLIEAGSDFFLMPSLSEPCGLNQIYSMKYGTLPVVRTTGGLADTVINYNEATGEGTGFHFREPTGEAFRNVIGWAVATWFNRPPHIVQLQQQAMTQDFSWPKSAERYIEVYQLAVERWRSGSTQAAGTFRRHV